MDMHLVTSIDYYTKYIQKPFNFTRWLNQVAKLN